jgi:RNA polymerase sigma-70 factor (ECF subfamily)
MSLSANRMPRIGVYKGVSNSTAGMGSALGRAQPEASQFESWLQPYWSMMARLARRISPAGSWEDILQESLANAWRKRSQFDPSRGSAQSWLLAIVGDQARKARCRQPRLFRGPLPDPTESETQWSTNLDLQRALSRLTDRRRLAVELYYYFGLPVDDVAEVMHCSPGTVKSTLADARSQLRALLEQE